MAYPPMTPSGRETTSISRDAIEAGYKAAYLRRDGPGGIELPGLCFKRVNTKAFFGYSIKAPCVR